MGELACDCWLILAALIAVHIDYGHALIFYQHRNDSCGKQRKVLRNSQWISAVAFMPPLLTPPTVGNLSWMIDTTI